MRKQISKAEFIRRVTSNPTIFFGVSPSGDEAQVVREAKTTKKPRYAICLSNQHLVFGVVKPDTKRGFIEDSHLELANIKPHTVVTCFVDDDILMVCKEWYDTIDDNVTTKWFYYKEVK